MNNNILALIIMAAGIIGCSRGANRGLVFAMLGVVAVVMITVSGHSASHNDFGPLIGLLAFVGTFGLIALFRKRG